MHSLLANRAQPYPTSRYAIFIAEIASTLNEALLLDHMLKIAKDDDERLYYLGSALENLRATFFRQAMFAEFERDVHARVGPGESLTGGKITQDLRRPPASATTATAQGVIKIDDRYAVEWAYIPHFYHDFYVYQYATSIAASSLFAERDPRGRARRARALPGHAEGGRLRLSVRAGEARRRGPRHARALPGARRPHEPDHGPDRGDPREARTVGMNAGTLSLRNWRRGARAMLGRFASGMQAGMARFVITSGVKKLEGGRFMAVASAIPYDVSQRSGPDERSRICESEQAARDVELELASGLSYEINARGDRVVEIHVHS